MGEVYEALDLDQQRPLALKVVRATECDQPDTIARLLTEAHLARRVRHPNVCHTYGFGIHEDAFEHHQMHFTTQELLHGSTLRNRLIQRGPLSASEVIVMARDLLQREAVERPRPAAAARPVRQRRIHGARAAAQAAAGLSDRFVRSRRRAVRSAHRQTAVRLATERFAIAESVGAPRVTRAGNGRRGAGRVQGVSGTMLERQTA
jgi:serine/threonine protein kinase